MAPLFLFRKKNSTSNPVIAGSKEEDSWRPKFSVAKHGASKERSKRGIPHEEAYKSLGDATRPKNWRGGATIGVVGARHNAHEHTLTYRWKHTQKLDLKRISMFPLTGERTDWHRGWIYNAHPFDKRATMQGLIAGDVFSPIVAGGRSTQMRLAGTTAALLCSTLSPQIILSFRAFGREI
jgi:hypothetical protein